METAADHEVARQLAPTGVLRAGINLSNPLLVTGRTDSGDPIGVSPDMARRVSEQIGVPVEYVAFPSPGAVADAVSEDLWDVALIAHEPKRAETVTFSPSLILPDRIISASGSCTDFWITRLSGRAP